MTEQDVKRRRWRSSILWAMAALMVIVALAIAGINLKSQMAASEVAESVAAIAASGLPETYGQLSDWYLDSPQTQNAAHAYLQALRDLDLANYDGLKDLPLLGAAELPALGERLSADLTDRCLAFLVVKADPIRALKRASQLGACRFPLDFSQGMQMELPHLGALRAFAYILQIEGIAAAEAGKSPGATGAVLASCGISHALKNEPLLISQLVRLGLMSTSLNTLERVLSLTTVSPSELAMLGRALTNLEDPEMMYRALVGERCVAIAQFPNMKRLPWIGNMDQARFLDSMAEMLEWSVAPYTQRAEAGSHALRKEPGLLASVQPLSAILIPSLRRADEALLRTEALRRCALTALAVEAYRAANDHLPEGLAALGKDLPGDLFAGDAPLRFKMLDTGYVVYSVGPNGRDDGAPSLELNRESVESGDLTFSVLR